MDTKAESPCAAFEIALMVLLGLFAVSVFFSQSGMSLFGPLAVILLLVWRQREPGLWQRRLPRGLLVAAALFAADLLLGALMSDDLSAGFGQVSKYWNMLLAGLLFTAPIPDSRRRALLWVFIFAASAAGVLGIYQFISLSGSFDRRAMGMGHPIHYATILSFAFLAGAYGLMGRQRALGQGKGAVWALLAALSVIGLGILLSKSRAVWVALFAGGALMLSLEDLKRGAIFVGVSLVAALMVLMASADMRHRAISMFTSWQEVGASTSSGNRYVLWRGALMIAAEEPIYGTGTGDFEADIARLVENGSLPEVPYMMHAHNVYLQWLATLGVVGLVALVYMLRALMLWGLGLRQGGALFGGAMVIAVSTMIITGGLMENSLGISKILSGCCFLLGVGGGVGREAL